MANGIIGYSFIIFLIGFVVCIAWSSHTKSSWDPTLDRTFWKYAVIGWLLFICAGGFDIYRYVKLYEIDVAGHLKRAADASTIELAKSELEFALKNMETYGWTQGYTSIVYNTPDEDIGFWYKNIKDSLKELNQVGESVSALERTNILLKLRETLLDHRGERGEAVTHPTGVAMHPYNALFFTIQCLFAVIACVIMWVGLNKSYAQQRTWR